MISPGSRLGPYEITSRLGAGGMGEVYRARDTRLDRSVAIKVLPPKIAADEQARARFEREARAISSLNHPNICSLYDVGEENGVSYLVMELIDGQTLADVIARGALPLHDALRYAIDIAAALDRAHRQGIVHRDLKPGNIMITKSGVKLLDFGLARLETRPDVPHDAPTVVNPITTDGMILGTLQYMSPEQLEGLPTDARTDIFSFGCILYEMVSGRRAFAGSNSASIIAAIMNTQPPPLAGLAPIPPLLDRLVKKCLVKNADDRWQNAGDLATELRWIAELPEDAAAAPAKKRRAFVPWIVAALAVIAALALALLRKPAEPASVVRLSVPIDADRLRYVALLHHNSAVSPNGEWLVYSGLKDGKPSLWLRNFSTDTAAPIPKTEGASDPFWSPDSKNIAYFTSSKLLRITVSGEGPTAICDVLSGATVSAAWGADGTILFADLGTKSGLLRVPASGGTPESMKLSSLRPTAMAYAPSFVDDDRFVYCDVSKGYDLHLHAHSLRSGEDRDLGPVESRVEVAGDALVWIHEGSLVAQRIDRNLNRIGTPVVITPEVWNYRSLGLGEFSAAPGVIVYATAKADAHATWFDRSGALLGAIGPNETRQAKLSRDGRRIVMSVNDPSSGTSDLWIADASRGSAVRLTNTQTSEGTPVFSPDGQSIAYSAEVDGPPHLYTLSIGGGAPVMVTPIRGIQYLNDWSPDGRTLLFRELDPKTNVDLWSVPAQPNSQPVPLLRTPFNEFLGRLSPDGKVLAYLSNASGRIELYVAPFANPSDAVQVSADGASLHVWSHDGKHLYYATSDRRLFACEIHTTPRLDAATPTLLFRSTEGEWFDLDMTPDDKRFLIVRRLSGPDTRPLSAVINWRELLK